MIESHPHRRGRVAVIALLGLVWFSTSFFGGYLLGQADSLAGNHRVTALVAQAASRVGLQSPLLPGAADSNLSTDEQARFRVFWEAWSLVGREFYNREAVESQKMTYGAVKGMVQSLGDPYTAFSTPREKQMTDASLRGSFDGIGIQVDQRDGKLQVIAPIEGSPAERAGLKPGDIVLQVDGKDLQGIPLNDIVLLIRGPRGSSVSLTIARAGEQEALVIRVERAEIRIESVRTRMLDDTLGYLRITSFSASSANDTASGVRKLLEQGARGVVLDLRSNPGGFLNAAVDVTSQFMGEGVVLYQQSSNGQRQEYRAKGGGQATGLPVVVLIDKGSASASEIVAAALRDNGRAVLVGEKSYGKGSVQTVHTLSDSSGLRVTSAVWLTPGGQPLERNGLEPDLQVAPGADTQPGQDPQLDAAVQHLRSTTALSEVPAGV